MSREKITLETLKQIYIGKSPNKLLKDFPNKQVRILSPNMPYIQNFCKDRINLVVVRMLISNIWLG